MASTPSQQDPARLSGSFNNNKYATRKTITQGLVDIALLITNVSQLKALLDAADNQQFFTLLVTLLSISILLQVVQGTIYLVLGSQFDVDDPTNQPVAVTLNNMALSLVVVTTVINVFINVFQVQNPKTAYGPIGNSAPNCTGTGVMQTPIAC